MSGTCHALWADHFTMYRKIDYALTELTLVDIATILLHYSPILCHFRNNDLMPVIYGLTILTFWSLFHVISRIGPKCIKN